MAFSDLIHPESRRVLAPYYRALARCTSFVQRHPAGSAFMISIIFPSVRMMATEFRLPPSDATKMMVQFVLYFPTLALISWPLTKYNAALRTSLGASAGLCCFGVVNTIIHAPSNTPLFSWPMAFVFAASAFMQVILYGGYLTVLVYIRMRFWPRFPLGHCRRCGYNLFGLQDARCPECGTGFEASNLSKAETLAEEK